MFDAMVEDEDPSIKPEDIKSVFCSQSVVLMLRHALDPSGAHSGLRSSLCSLNSRLVSPRQLRDLLVSYGAAEISNQKLAEM
jgi:hypothetical protein